MLACNLVSSSFYIGKEKRMAKATEATVFFDNGDYLRTQINGTRESIKEYYLGKEFNLGADSDKMARATDMVIFDYSGAYEKENVLIFAYNCKKLGFNVYLAESNAYGFVTDDNESRVLSFSGHFGGVKLSGNYKSSKNGTGWRIKEFTNENPTRQEIKTLLYINSTFENDGYTSVKDYLKNYQSSSHFRKV